MSPVSGFAIVTALIALVLAIRAWREVLAARADRADARRIAREEDRDFRTAFHHAPIGIAITALDGTLIRANPALCTLLGREARDLEGRRYQDLTHPDDVDTDRRMRAEIVAGRRASYSREKRYLRPDGSTVTVRLSVALVRHADGRPRHFVSQLADVTAWREAERDLAAQRSRRRRADELFTTVFEGAPVGMALLRVADRAITRANAALETLTGPASLDGLSLAAFVHVDDLPAVDGAVERVAQGAATAQVEVRVHRVGREVGAAILLLSPVGHAGEDLVVLHVHDITERKALERRLQHLADHDPLTGLANRRCLERELSALLHRAGPERPTSALLLLDLDGFKDVNDTLGHAAGDELLARVAGLLGELTRPSDLLARLGGDEYALLLPSVTRTAAAGVAERITGVIRHDATVARGGVHARVTASVGVAMLDAGTTVADALVDADLALYAAKAAGRDGVRVADLRDDPVPAAPQRVRSRISGPVEPAKRESARPTKTR